MRLHVDAPWLFTLLIPAFAAVAFSRHDRAVRGLLALAAVCMVCAAAGVSVRWPRTVRVVALVDVSPSTRTANSRDTAYVRQRLSSLVADADVEVRYFADGETATAAEIDVPRTRLPAVDADAIVLFSDGRFLPPAASPPVYAVIDAALERPGDARMTDVRVDRDHTTIDVAGDAAGRSLTIEGATPSSVAFTADTRSLRVATTGPRVTACLTPGDAWPENDTMTAEAAPSSDAPWAIGVRIEGAVSLSAADLPDDLTGYLGPSAVVVREAKALSPAARRRLVEYAQVLGGALVLLDPPASLPPEFRRVSPLSALPPEPEATWSILLDASGSMAADDRWPRALDAAAAAVSMLSPRDRVDLATFAAGLNVVGNGLSPEAALARIAALRAVAPSGPTGLRAALSRLAIETAGPRKLLVISDADASLEPVGPLADELRSLRTQPLFVLTAEGDPSIRALAEAADGTFARSVDPAEWAGTASDVMAAAQGTYVAGPRTAVGEAALAGLRYPVPGVWRAYLTQDSERLAGTGENLAAARQPVGLGTVTSFAADVPGDVLRDVVTRLARPPSDPRLTVMADRRRLRMTVFDDLTPVNGLRMSARGEASSDAVALGQTAPGVYEALTPAEARILSILIDDRVVARRAVATGYAEEYDVIGNDRPALQALAVATGGRMIEPSERGPITLPMAITMRRTDAILAVAGFFIAGLAVVLIRAPYFPLQMVLKLRAIQITRGTGSRR